MLIINGTPITTCLRFFEHFDVGAILAQPDAFLCFAKGHLDFNPLNHACIALFELAASGEPLMRCISEIGFWQGMPLPEVPPAAKAVIGESYIFYKLGAKPGWERAFIMAAAATILAGASFQKPAAAPVEAAELLDFRETSVTLVPGHSYRCRYAPDAAMDGSAELRVAELLVCGGYSGAAAFGIGDELRRELSSGERMYAVVLGDALVSVLPDEVRCGGDVLRRDAKMGCITNNGERTCIPLNASSFVSLGEGQYLYLAERRLYMVGMDGGAIPYSICKPSARYVELAMIDGSFWLLTPRGIVKGCEGTPDDMQACYSSLGAAFERRECK